MMTSRSEYRLILRQDNADERLMAVGHRIGLVSDERFDRYLKKAELVETELKRVRKLTIPPSESLNAYLEKIGTAAISTGIKLADLIRRPQVFYDDTAPFDYARPLLPFEVREQVELRIKYEGYIKIQLEQVKAMRKLEVKKLSPDIDYREIKGLRLEAIEKLNRIKPVSLGQASRISGVNPADVSVLLIWLEQKGRRG
jgi:tRNA uridine 5-carboxymethylaminomethyl modification enzyme